MVDWCDETGEVVSFAVEVVRRSFHGGELCKTSPRSTAACTPDFEPVVVAFRHAQDVMIEQRGSQLVVAIPGTVQITRHERRLLRATAAAQVNDEALVDNLLFKLAPRSLARSRLVKAVTMLATNLGLSGYWWRYCLAPAARLDGGDLRQRLDSWPAPACGVRSEFRE